MKQYILLLFLFLTFLQSRSQQGELPDPGSMKNITVFGFSQTNPGEEDPQVFQLNPDINIRTWSKWDIYGNDAEDFDFSTIERYHQNNIVLTGGLTASIIFYREFEDSAKFLDYVTRDASDKLVEHNYIVPGAYRGNIASPGFRKYIIQLAKIQIDGGVDGLFFDEINAGYSGNTFNGNEGFDDYHLKDFNKYLVEKYPSYTSEDFKKKFKMKDDNILDPSKPLNDLSENFNYREYLHSHNFQTNPMSASNLLSLEWGWSINNRLDPNAGNFVSEYNCRYWKEIVSEVRNYAREKYGKNILITSNGIFPFVDFNSLGMYNWNIDDEGKEAKYVPLTGDKLDGKFSLQPVFRAVYNWSQKVSGESPVVFFIDWPTDFMTGYLNLSQNEKKDYWKIYAAEAYANGLFMAFHLKTSIPEDPTAEDLEMLPFLSEYSSFYRKYSHLYQNKKLTDIGVLLSNTDINYSALLQKDSSRISLHLVNHNYTPGQGIVKQENVSTEITLDSIPKSVYMVSPDFSDTIDLPFVINYKTIKLNIPSVEYYSVIILDYKNIVNNVKERKGMKRIKIYPNPSDGKSINIDSDIGESKLIKLYNCKGGILKEVWIKGNTMNINLPQGIYFISVENDKTEHFEKLIIY